MNTDRGQCYGDEGVKVRSLRSEDFEGDYCVRSSPPPNSDDSVDPTKKKKSQVRDCNQCLRSELKTLQSCSSSHTNLFSMSLYFSLSAIFCLLFKGCAMQISQK